MHSTEKKPKQGWEDFVAPQMKSQAMFVLFRNEAGHERFYDSVFRYLCSEIEATFWFHNFLQDKGFDSCTADVFVHHTMLQVGVIHSQANKRSFFTDD